MKFLEIKDFSWEEEIDDFFLTLQFFFFYSNVSVIRLLDWKEWGLALSEIFKMSFNIEVDHNIL